MIIGLLVLIFIGGISVFLNDKASRRVYNPVWAGEIFPGPVKLKKKKLDLDINQVLKGESNIIINPRNYWKCYISGGSILDKDRVFLCTRPKYTGFSGGMRISGLKQGDLVVYRKNGVYYLREAITIVSGNLIPCLRCKNLVNDGNFEYIDITDINYIVIFEVKYEKENAEHSKK